jgi:predicted P-loop ATPase/GTPase
MSFIFNFYQFENYYTNTNNFQILKNPITMNYFSKDMRTFTWNEYTTDSYYKHPYTNNLYISSTNKYIFFSIPNLINGVYYSDHFSFGRKEPNVKTKLLLIDIHYTIQDPINKISENALTKCFINDNTRIDLSNIYDMICQIPRSKSVSYIFNEQFINYIAIIIATPF